MTYEQFHAHQAGCSRHPAFRNRDFDESCVTQTGTGASAGIFDGTAASDIAASGWTDDVYLGRRLESGGCRGWQEAVTLGVSKRWAEYAARQTETYDFDKTRYQSHDGLDCSGYIGWLLYNVFHTRNGETGYVTGASKMARACAARSWEYLVQETINRAIYAVWKGMSG